MILVSFLVLVIAILLLIVGLVRETAGVIWAAIAASGISFVLLVIGNRLASRSRRAEPAPPTAEAEPALATPAAPVAPAPSVWAPPGEEAVPPTVAEERPAELVPPPPPESFEAAPPAAPLPIDNYDDLSVASIVPLLSSLSYEELITTRDHEATTGGRKTL